MKLKDIFPFARFVRYITLEPSSKYRQNVPVDARLFYATQGTGYIAVAGKKIKVDAGNLLFINSGIDYHLLPNNVSYLVVNFDFTNEHSNLVVPLPPVAIDEKQPVKVLQKIHFDDAKCFNEHYLFENCQGIHDLLVHLEMEFVKKMPYFENELTATMISILTRLARIANRKETTNNRFDIDSIISYIQDHYQEQIDNRSLANVFHFHPVYLSTEFKKIIGMPLHRYIMEFRILKACALIETNYSKLKDVAEMCGFNDLNYFSRYFKKIIGISPTQFAVMHKNHLY